MRKVYYCLKFRLADWITKYFPKYIQYVEAFGGGVNAFHHKTTSVQNLIVEIIKYERLGNYEQAFELLQPVWRDITEIPDVSQLSPTVAAELLLRCGSIVGYLGNLKQISNAQEYSQNLLTNARTRFINLYKPDKIAECENHLALAYYRKGEYNEASDWIAESLSHKINNTDEIRLHSHIIKSMILLGEEKFQDVISYLKPIRQHFESADFLWRGCYCTNLSLAYKNLGQLEQSLRLMTLGRFAHQKSGHLLYLATIENNLAQLHKLLKDFQKADKSINNAIELFRKLGDARRAAFSIDTKAQIYIAKSDFINALKFSDKAVEILKCGDNAGMLSKVYLTKASAFLHLEKIADAVLTISEAIQLAKIAGEAQAKKIAEAFELVWLCKFPPRIKKIHDQNEKELIDGENIELDLPPEILPNYEFFGVWIKNDNLRHLGLKKGNLAVIIKTEVKNGDLVAVTEIASDLASIGFFERQFGLVCLDNLSSEPDLFNENQIQIMGLVVGFSEPQTNAAGRYTVKPISTEKKLKNDSQD